MIQDYIDEIKRICKKEGISINLMARDLGISDVTIRHFLHGRHTINAEYFLDICEYVGIEIWGTRNDR